MKQIVEFCNCIERHEPDCRLGKRLKIKYHPLIQKIWDIMGVELTEELIDFIIEIKEEIK